MFHIKVLIFFVFNLYFMYPLIHEDKVCMENYALHSSINYPGKHVSIFNFDSPAGCCHLHSRSTKLVPLRSNCARVPRALLSSLLNATKVKVSNFPVVSLAVNDRHLIREPETRARITEPDDTLVTFMIYTVSDG